MEGKVRYVTHSGQLAQNSPSFYASSRDSVNMYKVVALAVVFLGSAMILVECIAIPGYAVAPVKLRQHEKEQQQDLSKVPGIPGHDYPLYHSVPATSFSCKHVPALPGIYANVETGCQAYHVCHDGREGEQGASFLCTNGTIFNQAEFACDWWYNVNCHEAPSLYRLNADPLKNPYIPKPKPEDQLVKYAPIHQEY